MQRLTVSSCADRTARACAIALGFAIPISVAADNALLAITALAWLVSGDFRARLAAIDAKPVALAAAGLFGLLALGLTYGERNPGDGPAYLFKYVDLLFIPVFLTIFRDERTRVLALKAYCGAVLVDIVISYMAYHDLMYLNPVLHRMHEFPAGFKSTITHSLLVSFSALLFAVLARQETRPAWRAGFVALALVAAHNVAFIVIGRTGYLVLAALLVCFFAATLGRRGVLVAMLVGGLLFGAAYVSSNNFYERINRAIAELSSWRAGESAESSVGLRMEFYRSTLQIVRENPILGAGTGAFPLAYSEAADGSRITSANPHNEYLLIAAQIGLAGLACLIYLFWQQWRCARRLKDPLYRDLGSGLVLMFVIGCVFNSLLLDHGEGLLFAWLTGLIFSAPRRPAEDSVP